MADDEWSPQGVGAVTLFVEDLAAARDFYERAFGLPVHFADAESVVFAAGRTLVNLLQATSAGEVVEPAAVGDASAGVRAVYTLPVGDVDAVCTQLAARGVALLNGPADRPWGVRTASFRDPAGHVWEIAH